MLYCNADKTVFNLERSPDYKTITRFGETLKGPIA